MITVAVEGDTDVPFAIALCRASGFEVRPPIVMGGKPSLDPLIPGLAAAGQGSPHLVIRDLDQDAPCAAVWLSANRPANAGPYFALRLAVRAVEAWFLADRRHAAKCLHVGETRLPISPDEEDDPKLRIVNLARHSTKPVVKRLIVPAQGASRKAGAGYASWLLDASRGWRFDRAVSNSPSLERAHRRLSEIAQAWSSPR